MHDLRAIRETPDAFDAGLAARGTEPASARILDLDERRRAVTTRVQEAQARRNEASKAIGAAMGRGEVELAEELKLEVGELKTTLPALEDEGKSLGEELDALLAGLPNLPDPSVPQGADESENVEQSRWGQQRSFDFDPKEHADLGPSLGLEFDTAAEMSGARFTFLRGQMARLERALGQFMLDLQSGERGYIECVPPLLVRDEAVFGTGQLPKFADDLFHTTDGRWLIPTAEVCLTNSVREQIIDDLCTPIRLTALTPCFRSEAGAAGKDTRGYIRQHQFSKVELVSICRDEDHEAEHEHMVRSAELVLEALDLPYRRMLLCTGDMGFGARKTYDLEVWLPGQGAYREISSVSWCGEFQARRMNARTGLMVRKAPLRPHAQRLGPRGRAQAGGGAGELSGRDGSVRVPQPLKPYMGGLDRLVPVS